MWVEMRLYEFSKQCDIPSKELMAELQKAGFAITSHMSVLSQKEIDFLSHFVQQSKTSKATPLATKETKSIQKNVPEKEPIKHERPVQQKEIKTTIPPIEQTIASAPQEQVVAAPAPADELFIEPMSVATFAEKTHKAVQDVIVTLLKMGIIAPKNQLIATEVVEKLVHHYNLVAIHKKEEKAAAKEVIQAKGELKERLPVVVVIGHVDHGKTTLLDFIRETHVAAREKGGITQHLGAYEVTTAHGNVIFLDTPGHEAFSKMRGRGIGVADLAVLVVAADDGIMPQTIEAIKFAKNAGIPIIVAINKIDKVDATRIEGIRRQLATYDLVPEEWGGNVVMVPISAKTGKGVDHLLEVIVLQSQLMELKANDTEPAMGHVLESKLEKGRGAVATVLIQQGKARVGDFFVCGNTVGKICSLVDSRGGRLSEVGPSIPVQVAGFELIPNVGDIFKIVSAEEYRRVKVASTMRATTQKIVIEGAFNILIKTDSNATKEALQGALVKLSKQLGQDFNIIYEGIGQVNESDVILASSTNATIYTLHVKQDSHVAMLARRQQVPIYNFDIIYKFLEALEGHLKGMREVKMVKVKIGEATVRQVFNIKNIGVIAGCYVNDGRFIKDGFVVVYRRNKKIGEGKIASLQRERKTVKEVHSGFECGFMIAGYADWAIDDRVECFMEVPEKEK